MSNMKGSEKKIRNAVKHAYKRYNSPAQAIAFCRQLLEAERMQCEYRAFKEA